MLVSVQFHLSGQAEWREETEGVTRGVDLNTQPH